MRLTSPVHSAKAVKWLSMSITFHCLGNGQILMVHNDRHHQRKAAKIKRNELKLVLNFDKDGKKEEKMVKEVLKEGRVITNFMNDYINLLVRIAHIICNHPIL
jgi:hypothetical protein